MDVDSGMKRAFCTALLAGFLVGCSVLPPLTLLCVGGFAEREGKRVPAFLCREVPADAYPE